MKKYSLIATLTISTMLTFPLTSANAETPPPPESRKTIADKIAERAKAEAEKAANRATERAKSEAEKATNRATEKAKSEAEKAANKLKEEAERVARQAATKLKVEAEKAANKAKAEERKKQLEEAKQKGNAYLSKIKFINSDYKAAIAKANKDLATALGSGIDEAAKTQAKTIHAASLIAAKKAKEEAEKLLGPKPLMDPKLVKAQSVK